MTLDQNKLPGTTSVVLWLRVLAKVKVFVPLIHRN